MEFNKPDYKIDSLLPLTLYARFPFIYTGPDSGYFPLGMIPSIMKRHGRVFQRFYPFRVYEVVENHIAELIFCFGLLYLNDSDELVMFLTQPCWLNTSEIQQALTFMLTRIIELAKSLDCKIIETELHDKPNSVIAHPTSLSHFSYDLSKICILDDLSSFQSHGFQDKTTYLCYEQTISEMEKSIGDRHQTKSKYSTNRVSPTDFIDLKKKTVNFPSRAYTLSNRDPAIIYRNTPFFYDTIYSAFKRSRWLHGNDVAGFIRWFPNLFEPSTRYRIPFPLIFRHIFENYPFESGKIIDWAFAEDEADLVTSLLFRTLRSMHEKGLKKIQIDYVSAKDSYIKTFLEDYAFRRVHRVRLLHKRVG